MDGAVEAEPMEHRSRVRRLWVVACALLWAGPSVAMPPDKHLVAIGDSLTAGSDWMLHLDSLAPTWTWEDHGQPGWHSWDAADEIHCSPSPENCQVSQSTGLVRDVLANRTRVPGDVVVLLWGTNDIRHVCWSEANPTGPDDCRGFTRQSLAQMVDDALADGYPVVLGIPPPTVYAPNSPHTPAEIYTFMEHKLLLRDMILEIAAERPGARLVIADADLAYQALPGWSEWIPGWNDFDYYRSGNFVDGVHPGIAVGPSGGSGRYHLAEVLVAGVEEVAALPVPSQGASGLVLLAAIVAGAALRAAGGAACSAPIRRSS